jgi:GNAT superfamily N-acetyltransferase
VIRRLAPGDVDDVVTMARRTFTDLHARLGEDPLPPPTPERTAAARWRVEHLGRTDPEGAVVAEVDGVVVGAALAMRRDRLWGLSLLVVDPSAQGRGVGRALLDATLAYADGCDRAIILSSLDPRAMRRYFRAGFALHPQVLLKGTVDRAGLDAVRNVRAGGAADLDLADAVDAQLRGASHRVDFEGLLARPDVELLVADGPTGRGYALFGFGRVLLLGATRDDAAAALLTEALARSDGDTGIDFISAGQDWAIDVGLRAGLRLAACGPVFWRNHAPPAPYLPSGAYL